MSVWAVDLLADPAASELRSPGRRTRARPIGADRLVPVSVWALCTLFGVLLATSSVATPLFLAPDEFVHADLALRLADDPHYPEHDGRRIADAIKQVSIPYFGDSRDPNKTASGAPDKAGRGSIDALGGSEDDIGGTFNQQPQHPPLYYQSMALAIRLERALHPGEEPPALVTEVALLRLVNVVMVMFLPLAAWATAHRLDADRATALTAAVSMLLVPQLTHIGSTINNDNLLIALGAVLAVLLAGVVKGDRSARTSTLVAVVIGLALLTKGFAFFLLPWLAVSYLVAARRRATPRSGETDPTLLGLDRRTIVAGVVSGAGAAAISAWWWIGNRIRTGSFAPSLEETLLPTRPGFAPDVGFFVPRFGAYFTERFWGWFGLSSARMPLWAITLATVALLGLVVVGLTRPGGSLRRTDLVVGLAAVVPLGLFVVAHSWSIYARSGQAVFIQGRYLFAVLVPLMVVAASGLSRLVGRWAPPVTLVAALGLQALGFATMLDDFWGPRGAGLGEELRALVAWSAWPGEALGIGAVVGGLVVGATLAVLAHDLAPSGPPPQAPASSPVRSGQ